MPWIEPIENYARPPRLARSQPSLGDWGGQLDTIDGEAVLEALEIKGAQIELSPEVSLELVECVVANTSIETGPGAAVDLIGCTLVDCDLSQVRFGTIRGSRLVGCKLTGADLSDRTLRDVVFERCTLTYGNFRMSKLDRTRFDECRLLETDFGEATLTDVVFDASELTAVNIDRSRMQRVDFRGARELGLTIVTNLDGCLLDDAQVLALSYQLALAAGAFLERDPEP